jgi:hypothetical protein
MDWVLLLHGMRGSVMRKGHGFLNKNPGAYFNLYVEEVLKSAPTFRRASYVTRIQNVECNDQQLQCSKVSSLSC